MYIYSTNSHYLTLSKLCNVIPNKIEKKIQFYMSHHCNRCKGLIFIVYIFFENHNIMFTECNFSNTIVKCFFTIILNGFF